MAYKTCPLLMAANRVLSDCVENNCAWYVDGACALNTLARNLQHCASCKQVTEALCYNGSGDFEAFLATERQVTSGWISVEERLPENNDKVLAFTLSGKYAVARYDQRRQCWIAAGNLTVTHWMPLPDVPEVEA